MVPDPQGDMAREITTFQDEIRNQERRTYVLIALMLLLVWGVVYLGAVLLLGVHPWVSLILSVVVGGGYIWWTMSRGVQTVLDAADARPPNRDVRAERLLVDRVEEMAIAAGVPVPEVYVQDSKDPNAFAAGIDPDEAVVCVTTGGLDIWDQEELQGVIAHEMAHILNRDVRLATITVAVVGTVALLSEVFLRSFLWSGGATRNRKGGGAVIILGILLLVLAPIFTRLTYLAMSRNREHLADATAVRLTRNPEGLAQALEKLRDDLPDDPKGSRTVASLYLGNPWKRNVDKASFFSTHPPLNGRIRRIRSM